MLDKVKIILSGHALAPEHAHDTDAGYDLRTPVVIVIPPKKRVLVDTQVKMDIPTGYYGRLEKAKEKQIDSEEKEKEKQI